MVRLQEKGYKDPRIFSVSISQGANSSCNAGVSSEQPCLGKDCKAILCPTAQSPTPLALADTHLPLYLALLVSLDLLPEGWVKEQGSSTVVNQA